MLKGIFGNDTARESSAQQSVDDARERAGTDQNLLTAGNDDRSVGQDDELALPEIEATSGGGDRLELERQKRLRMLEKVNKDVEAFEDNLTNSEFHLKHSREQLRWFKSFAHQAELDLEDSFRVQRQRQELVVQLTDEQSRAARLQQELDVERANAAALQNRQTEFRAALEKARGELVMLIDADRAHREEIENLTDVAGDREVELLEQSRAVDRLVAENKILKETNERVSTELDVYVKRANELEKNLDVAREMNDAGEEEIERLSTELIAANENVDNYQAENVELRSRLENAIAENAAVEKRSSEKVRIREDELFSLRSRVDGLQSELRIRGQMLSQAVDELRGAKSEAKVAKSTSEDLSEQLVREVQQREEHREALLNANAEISEVNKRFNELLGELEKARRENEHLKRMIKVERQKLEFAVDTAMASEKEARDNDMLSSIDDIDMTKPN